MMNVTRTPMRVWRRVMVTSRFGVESDWYDDVDELLSPHWITMCRAPERIDAVRSVEQGLVDLAVVASQAGGDALVTLEMLRSVRGDLPCVLVTAEASANLLHRALRLDAQSVVPAPVDSRRLAKLLARLLGS